MRRFTQYVKLTLSSVFCSSTMNVQKLNCRNSANCFLRNINVMFQQLDNFDEILHLKTIHVSNFGSEKPSPLTLLSKLASLKLEDVFCNMVTALGIFFTIPVTVASAERSFSKLERMKNFQRTTMLQCRLTDLETLSIESDLAKEVNFATVIDTLASQKARNAFFKVTYSLSQLLIIDFS